MEVLNQKSRLFFASLAMLCLSFGAQAQNSAMEKAFSASYTSEYGGNYSKAIQDLLSVHTDQTYETSLRLGWLYYSNQNYKEACKYYKQAADLLPLSVEARTGYILPLSVLEKWDEVITVYKEILNIDKYHYTSNYRLGLIYYNRKDYSAAKQYLDNALNLYPFEYEIVVLSGWNYLMIGKKELAKSLFEKALLLYPGDASATEGLKY